MRRLSLLLIGLLLVPSTRAATEDGGIDSVLQQLDDTGNNLQAFSAKIKLQEIDSALGTTTGRVGDIYYQKSSDGSAKVHISLLRLQGNNLFPKDKIEYLLDGQWLIDRNYATRNEVKRQVLKPGQKLDLFKLGEGPFPLPIGQSPEDVRKQFDVKKIPPAKDDPANSIHLQLTPKPGTDLERRFKQIDIWVDPQQHMPVRVDTVDKQDTTRSTELSKIVLNPPGGLPAKDFEIPDITDQHWNQHVESLND